MSFIIAFYFILCPVVIIASIIGTFIYRRNRLSRHSGQPPFGYHETDEIFIDPTTGIKQQVWFNPNTGQRYYQNIEETK